MNEDIFKEIKDRQSKIESQDLEAYARNRDQFKNYWLQMTVLTSAILIGVLPLVSDGSHLIKSTILAELGLLLLIVVCVATVVYLQDVLVRERDLLADQKSFHGEVFSLQRNILKKAEKDGKDTEYIKSLFANTKNAAYHVERDIEIKHKLGGWSVYLRLFVDRNFNRFVAYGFVTGVILIAFSFIC